jgi:phosphatidylserine/phosphatidylglycerophosphate/cardiolipin synthase-like enzyme
VDYRYAIMQDKFIVVDDITLETGSFNFTAAAEQKNAENVLVLHHPALARQYRRQWTGCGRNPKKGALLTYAVFRLGRISRATGVAQRTFPRRGRAQQCPSF